MGAGPGRHQPDSRRCQDAVRRSGGEGEGRGQQQVLDGLARLGGAAQLGTVGGEALAQLGLGVRDVGGTEALGDPGGLVEVGVAAVLVEGGAAVDGVCPEEAVDLGDVDPAQQVRVGGGVRRAVGHLAGHPAVDRAHDVDRLLGVLLVTEGRHGEEATGAVEATPHVTAVAGVLRDRPHRRRVQRLQEQGAHAADEHGGVAVHLGDRAAGLEPARAPRVRGSGRGAAHPSGPATRWNRASPSWSRSLITPRPYVDPVTPTVAGSEAAATGGWSRAPGEGSTKPVSQAQTAAVGLRRRSRPRC